MEGSDVGAIVEPEFDIYRLLLRHIRWLWNFLKRKTQLRLLILILKGTDFSDKIVQIWNSWNLQRKRRKSENQRLLEIGTHKKGNMKRESRGIKLQNSRLFLSLCFSRESFGFGSFDEVRKRKDEESTKYPTSLLRTSFSSPTFLFLLNSTDVVFFFFFFSFLLVLVETVKRFYRVGNFTLPILTVSF